MNIKCLKDEEIGLISIFIMKLKAINFLL